MRLINGKDIISEFVASKNEQPILADVITSVSLHPEFHAAMLDVTKVLLESVEVMNFDFSCVEEADHNTVIFTLAYRTAPPRLIEFESVTQLTPQ